MERIRNIQEEWLRLGGSDAERAERELVQQGARAKPDTPLKDLEDGAPQMFRCSFGFNRGTQYTEASAQRVKLEGYWVLRAASLRAASFTNPLLGRIYLMQPEATRSVTLDSGEFSLWKRLSWDGELWTQGTWYVDALVYCPYDVANGCTLDVVAQRMLRGLE